MCVKYSVVIVTIIITGVGYGCAGVYRFSRKKAMYVYIFMVRFSPDTVRPSQVRTNGGREGEKNEDSANTVIFP